MARIITIRLTKGDDQLKELISELKESKEEGNPYFNRSESEIAKMILARPLAAEHKRYCGKISPTAVPSS